jgi:hypothetical protein
MPSLLDPDEDQTLAQTGAGLLRIGQDDGSDQGAALADLYRRVSDYMDQPAQQPQSDVTPRWDADNPVGTETTQTLRQATPIVSPERYQAHQQVQQALELAPTIALGMLGDAPGIKAPMDNPAFAKWFGGSKVVDEAGQPLRVYKGMYPYDWTQETTTSRGPEIESINRPSDFPSFAGPNEPGTKIAGFFSDNPKVANFFSTIGQDSGAVYPVHLSLQNPYVIDAAGRNAGELQFMESGKPFRDAIRSGKYDGVIIRNTADEGNVYVALHPGQIKSAIGNRGTYDPKDPRINYGIAGLGLGLGTAATQQGNGP